MSAAVRELLDLVEANSGGAAVGITSVCSAHPLVIVAAVQQSAADGSIALIEATSNQVDQFGGYTGMTPADFRDFVHRIAAEHGLPAERILLGGDHLGPNAWRGLGADEAMMRAEVLVDAYVTAGFAKIHLDCSTACEGDPAVLGDDVVAARAARLARVAEAAATRERASSELLYVVGTEVPVPGGAHETIQDLSATPADAARRTIQAHRDAFERAGVADAFDRVVGLVVQPGVEFDHLRVIDYDRQRTVELQQVLTGRARMVFEAHSTDYQTISALRALVQDHWAVLKVGPGLTFALREALLALVAIETELVPSGQPSGLFEVVEQVMLAEPRWWQPYYPGEEQERQVARRFSYSDRVRYYWPDPAIQRAQAVLFSNLAERGLPLPLLSQYLPDQYTRVRDGTLTADPRALVVDRIRDVLRGYARACGSGEGTRS